MATYGSDRVGFALIDGYSILGALTELSHKQTAETEDTTVLGSGWAEAGTTGRKAFELAQAGFYDDTAGSVHDAMVATNGGSRVAAIAFEPNAIGNAFIGFAGVLQASYERVAKGAELHKANAEYQGSGQVDEGVIVAPLAAHAGATGDTTATPLDSGAASADGGVAYLELPAVTLGGYTSVTVKLRHSADNVTYADLAAFTAATDRTAQRVEVPGTVNRYLAVSWSATGSGSNPAVTFMVGFARG